MNAPATLVFSGRRRHVAIAAIVIAMALALLLVIVAPRVIEGLRATSATEHQSAVQREIAQTNAVWDNARFSPPTQGK